jgi:hypothetical protein
MLRTWLQRFSIFTFLLGFALNVRGDPDLQILQDHSARVNSYSLWSSVIRYSSPTSLSRGNVMAYAKMAYEQMVQNEDFQGTRPERQPVMMSAMAIGDHIYFASSLKNGGTFWNEYFAGPGADSAQIARALRRCQLSLQELEIAHGGVLHRTGASCAEIMAVYLVRDSAFLS